MAEIRIGTCGYRFFDPGEDWQQTYESKLEAYSDVFPVGELNRTFYSLPQVSTAERWQREAVDDFVFTMKAWQGLTHAWRSPTWNNHRDAVPAARTDEVGMLQPTEFVRDAWARTREIATALEAAVVVVQTPPSFDHCDEHAARLRELFGSVDRGEFAIGWEPRGDWRDHPERVADLCEDLDLLHVVDLLRTDPVVEQRVLYTRLHGLNDDPYDSDYDYSDAELEELAARLRSYADTAEHGFALFNNYEMQANAGLAKQKLADSTA